MTFSEAVLYVLIWASLLVIAFSLDTRIGLLIGGMAALAWTIERRV